MLPGVYTIEAAAQAADILMMTTERYAGKLPLFMGVREATFRRKILPGDTLEIHVSLLEEKTERAAKQPCLRGAGVCGGRAGGGSGAAAGLPVAQ